MGASMYDHQVCMPFSLEEIWNVTVSYFENEKFEEALQNLWVPLTNWEGYECDPIRVMEAYFASYAGYVAKIFFEDEVQKTFVQSKKPDEGIVFTSLRVSEFYKGLVNNFKKYLAFHKDNFSRDYAALVDEVLTQATNKQDISRRFDTLRRLSSQYSVLHSGLRGLSLSTIKITKDLDFYGNIDEFNVLSVCRKDDEVVFEIIKSVLTGVHDYASCKEHLRRNLHESYTWDGFYSQITEYLN